MDILTINRIEDYYKSSIYIPLNNYKILNETDNFLKIKFMGAGGWISKTINKKHFLRTLAPEKLYIKKWLLK